MSVNPDDRNLQPKFSWSDSSIFHSIYYVVFMFVASLCSIQLFIGVSFFVDLIQHHLIACRFSWKFLNKEAVFHP